MFISILILSFNKHQNIDIKLSRKKKLAKINNSVELDDNISEKIDDFDTYNNTVSNWHHFFVI